MSSLSALIDPQAFCGQTQAHGPHRWVTQQGYYAACSGAASALVAPAPPTTDLAQIVAEAEARGAERVRGWVEAVLPDMDATRAEHRWAEERGEDCGCSYKDCYECGKWHDCTHGSAGLVTRLRAALADREGEA